MYWPQVKITWFMKHNTLFIRCLWLSWYEVFRGWFRIKIKTFSRTSHHVTSDITPPSLLWSSQWCGAQPAHPVSAESGGSSNSSSLNLTLSPKHTLSAPAPNPTTEFLQKSNGRIQAAGYQEPNRHNKPAAVSGSVWYRSQAALPLRNSVLCTRQGVGGSSNSRGSQGGVDGARVRNLGLDLG